MEQSSTLYVGLDGSRVGWTEPPRGATIEGIGTGGTQVHAQILRPLCGTSPSRFG